MPCGKRVIEVLSDYGVFWPVGMSLIEVVYRRLIVAAVERLHALPVQCDRIALVNHYSHVIP